MRRQQRPLRLRTSAGCVTVQTDYGQEAGSGRWLCPQREAWGLGPHQKLTPGLADRLCFTVTATGSYAEAAAVAGKWGCASDAATLHALVQRVGARAVQQTQARLKTPAPELQPQRAPTELAVLMLDGWQVRQRGPGWGRRKTSQPRVEWHEMKMGLYYRQEQAAHTDGGRGVLSEKVVLGWQGEPAELGRRLHWEGLRGGLARAKAVLVVADGAPWIWNLVQDRWRGAAEVLDFYHASQHLWTLGGVLHGEGTAQTRAWVESGLHRLRHGRHRQVLAEIAALSPRRGQAGQTIRREQHYFATQAGRMNYGDIARRGWPIGSGAVESACLQRQGRLKRAGQFWSQAGLRHLCAIEEARRNSHWLDLWKM